MFYAGTDERWGKGHRHGDGVCDKQLKHGDWRGQKVWQVPAETLKHHFDDIVVMLHAAAKICSQEPAVLQLQQPCHVFGDIHGNFSDLKYFESLLWPLGVSFTAGTFLWLGDYVDRGTPPSSCNCRSVSILISLVQALPPWRPSCTAQPPTTEYHAPANCRPQTAFATPRYMLALKVLHPRKWVLLRGNHETRDMNGWVGQYGASSFQHQCSVVFGAANGGVFYDLVNNVFDSMPIAAVISDQASAAPRRLLVEACNWSTVDFLSRSFAAMEAFLRHQRTKNTAASAR